MEAAEPTGDVGQVEVTEDIEVTSSRTMDVYAPSQAGPWPVVVMWHGQPASLDAPNAFRASMASLAARVAEEGAVVFNVSYGAANPAEYINDTGCSLQLAVESATDFGGDPDRVIVVGESFGGPAALMWALDSPLRSEEFSDCAATAESVEVLPGAVVAIASGMDPRNLTVAAWREADDAVLDAGTPMLLIGGNPDLKVFIATQEGLGGVFALPEDSIAFHEALLDNGYDSTLIELTGAHGTATNESSDEFRELVDFVVGATNTV